MPRRRLFTQARNTLGATAVMGVTLFACVGSATAAPPTTQSGFTQGGTSASGTATRPLTTVGPALTYCAPGYTCAFDLHDSGGALIWKSTGCGLINLGSMGLGDRISSIYNNRDRGTVQALNWGGSAGWLNVGDEIELGWGRNYIGAEDNIIDAVVIGC